MAKEKFERTKPHVNVGTIGHIAKDTSGQLEFQASASDAIGNPAPSTVLDLTAPASSAPQMATVVQGFDDEFVFDPMRSGGATSINFQVEILPQMIDGTPELQVTLAIWQDEVFVATAAGDAVPAGADTGSWLTISDSDLRPAEFIPVAGGAGRPDFDRPFQFGLAYSSQYSSEGLAVGIAIDNTVVEITTVPEPTSIILVLTLGVSLVWQRLCRGKRGAKIKPD